MTAKLPIRKAGHYLHTKTKWGIQICSVIMVALFLYWTFFTSSRIPTNSHKQTMKSSQFSIDSATFLTAGHNVSNIINSSVDGKTEAEKDTNTTVEVKHKNVPISESKSPPEDTHGTDDALANKTMTDEDMERHYFTLHPTKINPIEVDFIINGAQICGSKTKYMTLLILVPTLPSHSTVRNAIRSTYGSYTKQSFTIHNSRVEVTVRLGFLVGKDNSSDSDTIIRSESKQHGDIIYANFDEAYRNLTRKMLIGLKWISDHCRDLSFLLKIDEDVFVNIPLLVIELHKRPYDDKGSIYGHLHLNSQVYRDGQWAVSKDEFPFSEYPPYAAGNSYVISGNIIPRMFKMSEYIPHLSIEDAFITGCIAKIIGTKKIDMPGFTYWYDEEIEACTFLRDKLITRTKMTPNSMFKYWNASISYREFCEGHNNEIDVVEDANESG